MNAESDTHMRIPHERLRTLCDFGSLSFQRSDELKPGSRYLGQERAVEAIRFALEIQHDGHNVFVLGPAGSHRHGLAEELAGEQAARRGPASDWCYVHNFSEPERPRALSFEPGDGEGFRGDMSALIEELQLAIPAAFEGDDYRNQLKAIEAETQEEVTGIWEALNQRAGEQGIALMQTPTGYVLAPVRNGKVIGDEEFEALPAAEHERIQKAIQELGEELQASIERMPRLRKQHRERVMALNRDVSEHAVGVLLAELKYKYDRYPAVVDYLDEVQRDVIDNAQNFRETEAPQLPFLVRDPSAILRRYEVNLVVSNSAEDSAPVVYESNPTYANLIGKVEHRAEMGALVTDFSLVRAGALQRANEGILLLDAHRVLGRPFAWDGLKQALFAKSVRIESPAETYGFVTTTTLQPDPIPLHIKIVLIGERWLYYLLCKYDKEFSELFKVAADLDDEIERSVPHVEAYAMMIAERIGARGLLPFDRAAVETVIEEQSRKADDSERLSMHMRSLEELLMQADYQARARNSQVVERDDVRDAIAGSRRRLDRVQRKVEDAIRRDTLLIDTEGACVGQVNGLSVTDLGSYRFGHPVRITANTRVGTGNVIDIEREVELGGAIHSKGMMILSSALSSRYAREIPLSLNASVVFEQSYGGVEGDSASVAELSALLSSLSGLPIRQNIAVTGSINQLGRVQVVGGINEKIEGFFDICRQRGLDGSHGVIIPKENDKHLMLREDVVDAVRDGRFTIYGVQNIDEAIGILTGVAAGRADDEGNFPEGSVNSRVERQLVDYAQLRQKFGSNHQGNGNGVD
jgi:lon-related putative ATP-dependent protease